MNSMKVSEEHFSANNEAVDIATNILYREARYLDRQQWDEWLDLYHENVEYWVPSWDSEHQLIDNPRQGVSLMYYTDRTGLEDRIYRIRTGLSSASTPLPRTMHSVSNIEARQTSDENQIEVLSNWRCASYRGHESHEFYGHYEHTLASVDDGAWKIIHRKTIVKNELIPIPMDVYNI